jgi:hypothetical protein
MLLNRDNPTMALNPSKSVALKTAHFSVTLQEQLAIQKVLK